MRKAITIGIIFTLSAILFAAVPMTIGSRAREVAVEWFTCTLRV